MDTSMSRRAFLKNAALAGAALIAAPALLSAVEPHQALAEEGTSTCDVYCEPTEFTITNIIGIKQAYLTNPTVPDNVFQGPWPNESYPNATYFTGDETNGYDLTVELVNTAFQLTYVDSSASGGATAEASEWDGSRISKLKLHLPSRGTVYSFGAKEYASLSPFAGTKKWNINVILK